MKLPTWRRLALSAQAWAVILTVLAGPPSASAQTTSPSGGRSPSVAQMPVNPIAALAGQVGVSRCAGMARSIGEQVVGPNPSAGVVMSAESGADQALFSTSVETRDGVGLHFVSAFLTPNARGGCDAGYDDIRYWAKTCDGLVMEELRGIGAIRPLGPDIGTLVAGPVQHIYLMTAGTGCVSIRKALLF